MGSKTRRWARLIAPQNLLSVLVGIIVFLLGAWLWDRSIGVLVSAILGGLASGLVWMAWWRFAGPPAVTSALDTTLLGEVPPSGAAAPTLLDPDSAASRRYRDLVAAIQGHTTGQVLLVSPSGPLAGPSNVPLNLAVAATQMGRRAVLIDGDLDGSGVSRYSSTGNAAGLTDIARGEATLAEASQMWDIGGGSLLPVITAGTNGDNGNASLDGLDLAAVFDVIGERADLVLIDAPPITDHESTGRLAAHADGSILVVDHTATTSSLDTIRDGYAEAGAPIVGYIAEERTGWTGSVWLRMLKRSAATFAVIALVYSGATTFMLWNSWNSVARETLDVEGAREQVAPIPEPPQLLGDSQTPIENAVVAAPAAMGPYQSFLLVGSDEAAGIADVVLLTVLPTDGREPFMVSLPRDLYIPNRCTDGYSRINATLHGCGDINGPTFLSLAVEDFTGITVDHFALFNFAGFADVVDSVGGVEICVERDRRDWRAQLDLKAGCTIADGATTLAWVRSRHPQELVDGHWRTVEGSNDLLRNEHQQDVLLQLLAKLKTFDSPADLARKVEELSQAFTLDDGLGISDAIALAWSLRNLDLDKVNRLEVPVTYATTQQGQVVLRATKPFDEVLAESYPGLVDAASPDPSSSD
jgi:LCP family protein required for cell wall assembly